MQIDWWRYSRCLCYQIAGQPHSVAAHSRFPIWSVVPLWCRHNFVWRVLSPLAVSPNDSLEFAQTHSVATYRATHYICNFLDPIHWPAAGDAIPFPKHIRENCCRSRFHMTSGISEDFGLSNSKCETFYQNNDLCVSIFTFSFFSTNSSKTSWKRQIALTSVRRRLIRAVVELSTPTSHSLAIFGCSARFFFSFHCHHQHHCEQVESINRCRK